MVKITIELPQEIIEEVFENAEIKFSKAKVKRLKEIISEVELDVQERLEEQFQEILQELIEEEWGE
jgi:hypothetical protein